MSNKIKVMYEFSVNKNVEIEDVEESKNEAGDTVVVKKKVIVAQPQKFGVQKPTRFLLEEAELFYHSTVGKALHAGMMSAALLGKRVDNDGGVYSESEKKSFETLFQRLRDKEAELAAITFVDISKRTEEQTRQYEELTKEIGDLRLDMQSFQIKERALFDCCAESFARTRLIIWWALFLLHREVKGEWVPFFEGEDLKQKQRSWDELEEDAQTKEDKDFLEEAFNHAQKITAIWYYSNCSTQEAFASMLEKIGG